MSKENCLLLAFPQFPFIHLKTAVPLFSFLGTKHPEFSSNSDPLGQVFQMFGHCCCFPVLPVYAHDGLLSKAVSTVLFRSIISFEIKGVRKAIAWPTASVCFCWRREGCYCHLMNIGFNPDCFSPSLLTVLIIRTGDKQGLKWISFLALFIWIPGRWWFTFYMILRTGICERWNNMNNKRMHL